MTIDNTEIVRLAVMAAGNLDNNWQQRVVAAVPKIAAVFGEPADEHDPNALVNVARKVSEAHVFTAEYRGHEVDDNSKRVFVKLYDEKNQDSDYLDDQGCQTVRTEPLWSATGRSIKRILDGLESGQRIVCYRYSEQFDKTKKVGLLVHVEPLGRRRDSRGAPAGPPAETRRPAERGAPPSDARPAGGESPSSPPARSQATRDDNAALVEIERRFEALNSRQRIAYGRGCQGMGITDPMCPDPDKMSAAFELLDRIESQ